MSGMKQQARRAKDNTHKRLARRALRRAVARGEVVKPSTCEACGEATPSARLHGHHTDYSRPLDVRWLCLSCHAAEHRSDWERERTAHETAVAAQRATNREAWAQLLARLHSKGRRAPA
jgi:hypothetical protein